MSVNRLSKGPVAAGDILIDAAKIDKAFKIRIGTGGVAVGSSQTMLTSNLFGTLPAQALVYDAFVNVLSPSTGTTKTLSLGTSGTPTGFLNGISVGSSGLAVPVIAAGTSGAGTYGSLLFTSTTGNAPVQKTYASDSNASRGLSFTPNSSDWVGGTFSADLFIFLTDLTR